MKHALMSGFVSEEELNVSLGQADFYQNIARQLERIADHAVKISRLVQTSPVSLNTKWEKILQTNSQRINEFLAAAEKFVKSSDKKAANSLIKEVAKSSHHDSPVFSEMVKSGYGAGLILSDSFDRVSSYIVNMAEHTLAQAAIDA